MQEKDLEDAVKRELVDGRLPCSKAFEIAKALNMTERDVGDACNRLGIKISRCQLGCFE